MLKTVLIEGLPGSGKSTTALNLKDKLSSDSYAVELFLETSYKNPFRFESGTTQNIEPTFFIKKIKHQWEVFLSQNKLKNGFLIQESMTIQQQVNYLLWMNKKEEIIPLVSALFSMVNELNPYLIYLYQENAVQSFRETIFSRGESWEQQKVLPIIYSPFAKAKNKSDDHIGLISSFIEEAQQITNSLFELFSGSKLKVYVTENWKSHLDEISQFIYSNEQ